MKLIPAALPQTQAAPAGPSLEDIQAKRQIAALLAKEGQSTAPVQHWTQAAARVANAMMSSLNQSQAASEDARLRGEANDAIMGLLPSLTGGSSPAGMPPQPVKNDAQDAIDMTPDQKGVYQVAQGLASPGFQAAVQARQPQIDPNLVAGVKGFEGYAGKAYPDYKQYSIGYGTRATSPNEVIDQAEADRRLNSELGKAQGIVKAFAPNAPPGVQNALTSLTYNTGDKWTRSGLGALVKAGDYQGAQQRLLQYNKAGGVTNQGLVNRRQQEAQWMNGQPQKPQGVQVADASGGMDRAALEKMLANPYTKDFAEKLIMQHIKTTDPVDQARIEYLKAQTAKTLGKDPSNTFTQREDLLKQYKIDPASPEGQMFLFNGKLPSKLYDNEAQLNKKVSSAPKIAAGLETLRSMTDSINDTSFENSLGPIQGSTPDSLVGKGVVNTSRLYGELGNWWSGGNKTPNEVRNNITGATEALAAAIKPLIRGPGEGVWTDADQARLVSIVGDLAQSSTKDEFKRRLNAVRDRINSNFGLDVQFEAMKPKEGDSSGSGWSMERLP